MLEETLAQAPQLTSSPSYLCYNMARFCCQQLHLLQPGLENNLAGSGKNTTTTIMCRHRPSAKTLNLENMLPEWEEYYIENYWKHKYTI